MDKAEVAITGRRHRLDGEVDRVDPAHLWRRLVAEAQQHRGARQQRQRARHNGIKRRVEVGDQGADGVDRLPQSWLAQSRAAQASDLDVLRGQLVGGAGHHRPIAGVHPLIAARADIHLAGGGGVVAVNHRHRRQIAVQFAQRRVPVRVAAGDDEFDARRLEFVCGVFQTRLDHRRRREFGDVEDRPGSVVVGYRFAQHVVGEPCYHPRIRVGSPCQQRDFEIRRVVVPGAHDGERMGDVGEDELASNPGLGEVDVGQPGNGHAGVFQLLDDRHGQRIVAADDDVALH